MQRAIVYFSAAGLAAIACNIAPSLAVAQSAVCGPEAVTARGEPARFDWLARTKARANWRRKVRSIPTLGAPYSTWNNAAATEETCLAGPAGTVCTFTGIPCKK